MKTILHLLLTATALHAGIVKYELEIAEQSWAPEGFKPIKALTINGGIPGPTLRFKVGDTAQITVKNRLRNAETSTHWHGLLLPNAQDGVPYLTTAPIKPGTDHTFEFPLKHPGTYWYHSHTGLQEQRGVYGSIVVEPRGGSAVRTDAEHVLVLSDWTRENPNEVMRTLMSGSDWYSIKKGNAQSIAGAAKAGALSDYFQRERSRMAPMDVSDIAYDAFLVNGQRQTALSGKPGQKIRLRVINAASSTYFYLQSSTGTMTIIAADGLDVIPIQSKRLLMGMAETYDLVVTIPKSGKWEFRATAQDGTGHASTYFGIGELHPAQDPPKPNLYVMDDMLAGALDAMDMGNGEAMESERPPAPYGKLRSPTSTAFSKSAPRRTLELRLTGDMERYIWSINGKTAREDGVIKVTRGEVLRLEFINDTMMHHPMHLHGHFFRVIDGKDDSHAPLKHTIDVPPMGRRTIEFLANEQGDWLFHCHLLYHMHAGMTRVFSYDEQGDDHFPNLGEMAEDPLYFMAMGNIQNHMSMGMITLMNARNDFVASWDAGFQSGHSMGGHEIDYEIDFAWKRYINPNIRTLFGYRITNDMNSEDRFIGGIEYRLPYIVWSGVTFDSEGDVRLSLMKNFQLTPRLSLITRVEFDTGTEWQWNAGLNYTLTKNFSLITEYDSGHGFGGGIGFRF